MGKQQKNELVIFGCGGHAKVVADAAEQNGQWNIVAFCESVPSTTTFLGRPVWPIEALLENSTPVSVVVAVGENATRARIVEQFGSTFDFAMVQHPSATIASSVTLGPGTVVLANAVLNADATVAAHVIVNSGAILEHDCNVADFSSLAPAATVCGNCQVGTGAFVGARACVNQGLSIGDWSVVASGANVIENVASETLVTGTPAKFKRHHERSKKVY